MRLKQAVTEFFLTALILAFPGMAQATMYYTFEGTVSSYSGSSTIDFDDQALTVVFAVDFSETGYSVDSDGTHEYSYSYVEYADTAFDRSYFYAKLVSTNFTQMVGTATSNDTYGYNLTTIDFSPSDTIATELGELRGTSFDGASYDTSSGSFAVEISSGSSYVSDWGLGESVYAMLHSAISGEDTLFGSDFTELAGGYVTLTAISDTMPSATPIPGAIWLLGSGLVGLIGLKRKLN